jgi:hypothetical protein
MCEVALRESFFPAPEVKPHSEKYNFKLIALFITLLDLRHLNLLILVGYITVSTVVKVPFTSRNIFYWSYFATMSCPLLEIPDP